MLKLHLRRESTLVESLIPRSLKENAHRVHIPPIKSSDEGSMERVKQVLATMKGKSNLGFYDPSNIKFDLSKPNHRLWDEIYSSAQERIKIRQSQPSERWVQSQGGKEVVKTREDAIGEAFDLAKVTPDKLDQPLAVGDVVTLSEDSSNLFLVVATPKSLDSSTYIFVDKKGEIRFGGHVKIRCPGVIHEPQLQEFLGSLVQLEQKSMDIAPVGIADDNFSKSRQSLPVELRSQLPQNHKSEIGSFDSTDFVVAQAASQLLTNTDVNTFTVPIAARNAYSVPLTSLALDTTILITEMMAKLEVVHRMLQFDNYGQVLNTPRSVSIWELLYISSHLDHSKAQKLISQRAQLRNPNALGALINPKQLSKECSAAEYLAMIMALKNQPRLWSVHSSGKFCPSSVSVLPIQEVASTDEVVNYLKNKGPQEFAQYCQSIMNGKKAPCPPYYFEIIELFKDYISGASFEDPVLETSLVSILRTINIGTFDETDVRNSYEYSKTRAYELLMTIGESSLVNPMVWNRHLALPGHDATILSGFNADYYKTIDANIDTPDFYSKDPLAQIRKPFDEPVFCIDSFDAHEIDDGIALSTTADSYRVSVHIANPTSYIKPDSVLSKIALDKGTTTYLPEGPSMMLPSKISKIAGLGDGSARTFAIEWEIDRKLVDDYLENKRRNPQYLPDRELLEQVYTQIAKSGSVGAYTASNFPQGYTYDRVNEVLDTKLDPHYLPLYKLHGIAEILSHINVVLGQGINFGSSNNGRIHVENVSLGSSSWFETTNDHYQLYHSDSNQLISVPIPKDTDAKSSSQTLVSQCMVFANHLASVSAQGSGVNLVYRTQQMNLSPEVRAELDQMLLDKYNSEEPFTLAERLQLSRILTGSRYSAKPKPHQSLGLKSYATITSPLRRYVDMINQWQFQSHMLGLKNEGDRLAATAQHLSQREILSKQAQRQSDTFWQGWFIKEYLKLKQTGKIPDRKAIVWQLVIKSNPKLSNAIQVEVLGFNSLSARLEITDAHRDRLHRLQVGDVLTDKGQLTISVIDPIEDELVFAYR
ncbi:hypothetical protein DIRU0_E48654 [Diutina rugosa]